MAAVLVSACRGLVAALLVLVVVSLPTSCSLVAERESVDWGASILTHATMLKLCERDGVCLAEVRNPWGDEGDEVLRRYLLLGEGAAVPPEWLNIEATPITVPLRRAVMMSSVHAALAVEVDKFAGHRTHVAEAVIAIADTAYVVRRDLKARLCAGEWADAGSSMTVEVERLLGLSPDALFVSPMENSGHGPFEAVGVPIVECADYMEQTPLGRAEWMRFYARLFGCGEVGDSLFAQVEADYQSLVEAAHQRESRQAVRPRLLVDMRQGSSWYVPGGRSYLAALFADAGADYFMAADTSSGSIPLDPERVLRNAADTDLWLIKYGAPTPLTYAALEASDPRYAQFAPFAKRRIYACNTLVASYYEDVPFRPERLLRNLAAILATCAQGASPQPADSTYFRPLR